MPTKSKSAKQLRRHSVPKRPTNVSIDADLLRHAKELGVNLSKVLEEQLALRVREARQRRWLAENQAAVEAYNDRIDREGAFSDGLRRF